MVYSLVTMVLLALPLLGVTEPDDPARAGRGVVPPEEPLVVIVSDGERSRGESANAEARKRLAKRAEAAKGCDHRRVTVVRPDGSVETHPVEKRRP